MLYQLRKPINKTIKERFNPSRYNVIKEKYDTANCPPAPVLTTNDQRIAAATQMMTAMGAKSCQTDNANFAASLSFNSLFVSGGASANYSQAATLGCEQLIAQSQEYTTALSRITCIINRSKNTIKTAVTGINSVKFEAGPNSIMNVCGFGADIKQGIKVEVINSMQLTDEEVQQISKELKSVAETAIQNIQNNVSEAGATASGGKDLLDTLRKLQTSDYDSKVKEAVRSIEMKVQGNNTILITAKPGAVFNYAALGKCNFDQNIGVQVYASLIASNVLQSTFSSVLDQMDKFSAENKQITKGSGFASQVKAFWDNYSSMVSSGYLVAGIIVVALVIGLILVGPKLLDTFMKGQQGGKKVF